MHFSSETYMISPSVFLEEGVEVACESEKAFKSISLGPLAPEQSLLSTGQGFTS